MCVKGRRRWGNIIPSSFLLRPIKSLYKHQIIALQMNMPQCLLLGIWAISIGPRLDHHDVELQFPLIYLSTWKGAGAGTLNHEGDSYFVSVSVFICLISLCSLQSYNSCVVSAVIFLLKMIYLWLKVSLNYRHIRSPLGCYNKISKWTFSKQKKFIADSPWGWVQDQGTSVWNSTSHI